jgi:hypothetical protein
MRLRGASLISIIEKVKNQIEIKFDLFLTFLVK